MITILDQCVRLQISVYDFSAYDFRSVCKTSDQCARLQISVYDFRSVRTTSDQYARLYISVYDCVGPEAHSSLH